MNQPGQPLQERQKPTPYEVLKVALLLYNQSSAHSSNKTIEEFVPRAIALLNFTADALFKEEQ